MPPKQCSPLPEPDKPPLDQGQILWSEGLDIYCRLTGISPSKARASFRKLEQIAGGETLLAVLRDCAGNPPREAFAWIKRACEAKAGAPLVIDNDPTDDWGIQAWCQRLPGVQPTEHPADKRQGKWLWRNFVVDASARLLAEAAALPRSWRGDWSILQECIERGLHPYNDVLPVIQRVTNRGRFDPATMPLAYFNPMLTDQKRGAA